jgi:hypothetical protein
MPYFRWPFQFSPVSAALRRVPVPYSDVVSHAAHQPQTGLGVDHAVSYSQSASDELFEKPILARLPSLRYDPRGEEPTGAICVPSLPIRAGIIFGVGRGCLLFLPLVKDLDQSRPVSLCEAYHRSSSERKPRPKSSARSQIDL